MKVDQSNQEDAALRSFAAAPGVLSKSPASAASFFARFASTSACLTTASDWARSSYARILRMCSLSFMMPLCPRIPAMASSLRLGKLILPPLPPALRMMAPRP